MFLRSERLFLRPGWAEDRDELYAAIADPEVVCNLASAPWPYAPGDAARFLARPAEHGLPTFLITRPDLPGAPILGCIGLAHLGDGAAQRDEVELGYWIARPHWGQGYASEAARGVLSLARTLGHTRLVASHFIDNPASGAVLRKAGFRPTGRLVERYSSGRGESAMALEYTLALEDGGSDGDADRGDGAGDAGMVRKAA
ncbi:MULTISPECIES: GNAT family N-acetyltransferase [Novosphingobium]|uniref:GNAT family N-acetyltransferase n=1 Tax=Novosphingobium decolorationis TaxID=2698673 RepID=A0ABX8E7T0_9SPHN|nr:MULTISPECIES: GNAT family N-acetyltransferase [Novosphingobium]QVM84266.1 GNAT family N-acetyltransferase [Novosphingobium decolorationis]GAM04854.1 GNAT family acetyltransferase [Novosphingobium sp. MBES04]